MAAVDLSLLTTFGRIVRVTLSATPGNVRSVILPTGKGVKLSFRPETTAAKVVDASVTLADEAAIGGSAYGILDADLWTGAMEFPGKYNGVAISLASTAISPVVEILVEELK